ncbi:diaminopimelate decarboxylase [Amycolatopsis echigonensis]|uniref:Diaminopimelate decarboxylase n=1 Tax=Amycolatopsis echigonensis TaxID=2576905 RepID=A0A2N3WHL2_9PSEU|nr:MULTISPECIES: diaminopimelate decarboxylase [Amycolatopsis]MBB2501711.1 diaminopimelate decarboxylase [Amycolatopsis echigonensis]PKV93365.1 diaminopimelate decarboxylase [Amycolatopsis niigatensis]
MTLSELLPSLGCEAADHLEPGLWPQRTKLGEGGELFFAGAPVSHLAARFGTPAYLLDEEQVRETARAYRRALPEADVAFASKALCTRAVLRWVAEEGLSLDTCSAGEIAVARAVGFPAERILLHGNAKTPEDLKAALQYGVGRIVLDSIDEVEQLGTLAHGAQRVLIRVTPGVSGDTHAAITTGTEGQKFGFSLRPDVRDNVDRAVAAVLSQPSLQLAGLHCHIGSQVSRVDRYEEAARRMVEVLVRIRDQYGITLRDLDLGGGHAVPYADREASFDLDGYARRLRVALSYECSSHSFPLPRLTIEPGRAIVGPAGITVYRVCAVKRGAHTFVAVDGGMSDNPRPALYGARYTARLVGRRTKAARTPMTVVGRHCESGDVLADVCLPDDVHVGDLLAVPCTGAYHHSLASNYNLVGRPPLVGVRDGHATLLVRRETEEDLLRRC